MDASFRPLESWLFPDAVLARFAPKSCSGFAWGPDGLMYASGHDRPEVYALRLPKAGATLELVATLPVPTEGQAIDWDPAEPRLLWSIDRTAMQLHSTRMPPLLGRSRKRTGFSKTWPLHDHDVTPGGPALVQDQEMAGCLGAPRN